MQNITPALLDQLKKGQVVLFLGAGASVGASHPQNHRPPVGNQLAELLDDKFLGGAFRGVALDKIAELAISESDLTTVQTFIKDLLYDFAPGEFHKIIPTLPWRAIATTNYDLIIERAYDEVLNRVQQPVVFKKDGERVEDKLTLSSHFQYLKLHGCITEIHNPDLPLILTPSQYITHKKNRKRLFSRLLDLAYEHTFIFAGYTIADINIREIIQEIETLGDAKPRSYLITPGMSDVEQRMWLAKRITPIISTFEDFLKKVDLDINSELRKLVVETKKNEHPIERKFEANSSRVPSEAFWSLLNSQVEFIHSGIKIDSSDAKAFYKGYFEDWSPIEMNLDVSRTVARDIMVEVFLEDSSDKIKQQELVIIKGYAGSGKSVLLKRIAWDSAITLDKLCLVHTGRNKIDAEALLELFLLTKERIFLFIDSAAEHEFEIAKILNFATTNKMLLTVITAERYNEWNESCQQLMPLVTTTYELNYLNRSEISGLIALLAEHRSLGHLEAMNDSDRIREFEIHAERQLLVALHEVTYGKPLIDIVVDEYNSIINPKARLLYITVAILHRLGVRTRAGVISRMHSISFSDFKEELYAPLQYIVFDTKDKVTGDIYYHTRHSHIADVLFEHVLLKLEDRFFYYSQIISSLNIDYESDRDAFHGMTRARELSKIFSSQSYIKDIFYIANEQIGDNAFLLQQEAIFEMNRNGGDLSVADELLRKAKELAPWNTRIAHSLAELQLKRASRATNEFEREKYLRNTYSIANKLINSADKTPHAYHTLLKLGLQNLEDALAKNDILVIQTRIKEFEQTMTEALREFPYESFILDTEAQYKTLTDKHPEALEALEKAFSINKKVPFIAMRLSNTYANSGRNEDAIGVLKECVKLNPTNKDINYRLAKLLINSNGSTAEVKYFLRASFVKGGSGYEAQFWFARILYLEDNFNEANQIYKNLEQAPVDARLKREARGIIMRNGKADVFRGTINSIHASFAFLTRDGFSDKLFMNREQQHKSPWNNFRTNQRVKFKIGFTYRGPVAVDVELE
jgi:tetratricopeptide (TPR) repeat protein